MLREGSREKKCVNEDRAGESFLFLRQVEVSTEVMRSPREVPDKGRR